MKNKEEAITVTPCCTELKIVKVDKDLLESMDKLKDQDKYKKPTKNRF